MDQLVNTGTFQSGDEQRRNCALANLAHYGRMQQLTTLSLSGNHGVSDEGAVFFARAISRLPLVTNIAMKDFGMTVLGFSALMLAVINRCPQLLQIVILPESPYADLSRAIAIGMLYAAGRGNRVTVI